MQQTHRIQEQNSFTEACPSQAPVHEARGASALHTDARGYSPFLCQESVHWNFMKLLVEWLWEDKARARMVNPLPSC